MKLNLRILALMLLMQLNVIAFAQKNIEKQISDSLTSIANSIAALGRVNVLSFTINNKDEKIVVVASDALSQLPFRYDNVKRIYSMIAKVVPSKYANYKISCQSDKKDIEEYIPNFYRTISADKQKMFVVAPLQAPLVSNTSQTYNLVAGLQNRHIALWQSHGYYYNQKLARWTWQRARLLQTVEDLYTQSYILPYIVPMLENAGANVLLPRERDTQLNEVIVDNDYKSLMNRYHEHNDRKSWKQGGVGFANEKESYLQGENPFTMGTYRYVQAINDTDELTYAEWVPNIPDEGFYAVYVSYKSLATSAPDAHYRVYHKGGKTEFTVNQTVGGGTWIYLGRFKFAKGKSNLCKVVLTNYSAFGDKIITADAVKIGGGMGNIARNPNQDGIIANYKTADNVDPNANVSLPENYVEPVISSYPRYTEGARYWLQWAGVPDSVYSYNKGKNDYTDDFQSRGLWVNYLAGGSSVLSSRAGLGIPIDMAFAFHSDAGTTKNDSIIGTLGICTVNNSDGQSLFQNGFSRWASRDLTDIIQTQIVNDVRRTMAPEWTRRGLWNKSYSESRVPEVPTMLLELLSHQNFADMRYGQDPRFKFTVSRAIYKGMLKYLSYNSGKPYVVQPLPVNNFSARFIAKNKVELTWSAVTDSIEPTAKPDSYVIYARVDDGDFNNGIVVNNNKVVVEIQTGKIYSFKIAALNKGGVSFPSEILSVCRVSNERGEVMIVNAFDRISAPGSFTKGQTTAGFLNDDDAGVPYISDYSFVGKQNEFVRSKPWVSDDEAGFGTSYGNFETKLIAGNTFDYPYLHGKAIKAAGFSFVSCSQESVLRGDIDLNKYKIADFIFGKQKQTLIGNAKRVAEFKTFPLALQQKLRNYCQAGGNLLLSGAFIASDFYQANYINPTEKFFIEGLLKYKYKTNKASLSSKIKMVNSPYPQFNRTEFSFYDVPNEDSYYVESVDAIEPTGDGAITICRYSGTELSAGVAYAGKYKVCSFGFPIETIKLDKERNTLMKSVLLFFNSNTSNIKLSK